MKYYASLNFQYIFNSIDYIVPLAQRKYIKD